MTDAELFADDWDCCPTCHEPNTEHLALADCCRELRYWKAKAEEYRALLTTNTNTTKERDQC